MAPASDTSKILAALSYPLWIPVAIIAILIDPYKNEKFVRMHAFQGLGLGIAIWVATIVVGMIPFLGIFAGLVGLAGFVYEVILAIKAWQGEVFDVPVVTGFIKNYV